MKGWIDWVRRVIEPRGRRDEGHVSGVTTQEVDFEKWNRAQFPDVGSDAQRLTVSIGLDFGTSYTKVVIGVESLGRKYAVPMRSNGTGVDRYLAPTALHVASDGVCQLADGPGDSEVHTDLKMRLLERDFSDELRILMVAYLAGILRRCRGWFLTEKEREYRGNYLDWLVNVGLPTDSISDVELTEEFKRLVNAAWKLSVNGGVITLEAAEQVLAEPVNELAGGDASRLLPEDSVSAVPEFVAQVAAYVDSPRREEDLHVLVDVGGGTLDVTAFNVTWRDGELYFPIFAKSVTPLGAGFLGRERHRASGRDGVNAVKLQDPPLSVEDASKQLKVNPEVIRQADDHFRGLVQSAIREEIVYTKRFRYPLSPRWSEGVPIFVCGGGSLAPFYQDALEPFFQPNPAWTAIKRDLPQPSSFEAPGLGQGEFSRLAVACGLARDPDNLGGLGAPENIQDDRLRAPWSDRGGPYVSKEQV